MNNWKEIYNNKDRLDKIVLEMLMKIDGFDSPTGKFTVDDWNTYTQEHYHKISIQKNDTLFDVGCGSGAFLYPAYKNGHKVGGLDFAENLINLARLLMPKGDFLISDAKKLSTNEKYDIVLSHSLFFYINNIHAETILKAMIEKANKTIAIFDINDKQKEKSYHKIRMKTMTEKEYNKKYAGLSHYFYEKSFFEKIAQKFKLKIEIYDQTFIKYNNSQFRFNVIMRKSY